MNVIAKVIRLRRDFIVFYPEDASYYSDRYKLMRFPKLRIYPSTASLLGREERVCEEVLEKLRRAIACPEIPQAKRYYKLDFEKINNFIKSLAETGKDIRKCRRVPKKPRVAILEYPLAVDERSMFYHNIIRAGRRLENIMDEDCFSEETSKIVDSLRNLNESFFYKPLKEIMVSIFKKRIVVAAEICEMTEVWVDDIAQQYDGLLGVSLRPYKRPREVKLNFLEKSEIFNTLYDAYERRHFLGFVFTDILQSLNIINNALRSGLREIAASFSIKSLIKDELSHDEKIYLARRLINSYREHVPKDLVKTCLISSTTSSTSPTRKLVYV